MALIEFTPKRGEIERIARLAEVSCETVRRILNGSNVAPRVTTLHAVSKAIDQVKAQRPTSGPEEPRETTDL